MLSHSLTFSHPTLPCAHSCLRPNPPVRPNASQPQTSQTTSTMTTSMRNGDVAGKSNTASSKGLTIGLL